MTVTFVVVSQGEARPFDFFDQ